MDIMIIGLGMILIPVAAAMVFVAAMIFNLLFKEMIEARADRDIPRMISIIFIWSLVIGVALVLIGSV